MADAILNSTASIQCTHSARVNIVTSNTRVKVGGNYAVTISDTYTVTACPFQIPVGVGTKPQPCVKLQWFSPAKRVRVNGQAVLIKTSAATAICQSAEQIPQGSPVVVQTQMRVKAI